MKHTFEWVSPLNMPENMQKSRIHMEVYEKQGNKHHPDGLCVIYKQVLHGHFNYTQLNKLIDMLQQLAKEMKR